MVTSRRWLALAASTAALGTFALRYLAFDSFSNDHFLHLARAQQMSFGELPVRDFAESGFPLASGLSAAAQQAFGAGLHAEVILVALAYAAAAALSVVAGARASGSCVLGLIGAAITVAAAPVSYSYPKLLAYAAGFVAAAAYGTRPNVWRLVVLAAVVVFAFLLRHDHGVLLGCGSIVAVALAHPTVRAAVPAVATLIVAGALLASPYLAWVQAYLGVGVYLQDASAMSRREAEKADWRPPAFRVIDRSRPLFVPAVAPWGPIVHVRWAAGTPETVRGARERSHGLTRREQLEPDIWQYAIAEWSTPTLREIVTDPAIADTQGIDRDAYVLTAPSPRLTDRVLMRLPVPAEGLHPRENGVAVLYYAAWLLPMLALAVLWNGWASIPGPTRTVVAIAIVVQLLMSWTMLRDPLVTRVRDVVAPLAVLVPFLLARVWSVARSPAARLTAATASAAVVCVLLFAGAAAAELHEQVDKSGMLDGPQGMLQRARGLRERLAPPHERTGPDVPPVAAYLGRCTPPESRLLGLTLVPRSSSTRAAGLPRDTIRCSRVLRLARQIAEMQRRLAVEDIPYIIMDNETDAEMASSYPPVVEHVRAQYREVARFPVGVEKQSDRAGGQLAPGQYADYGAENLPCFW